MENLLHPRSEDSFEKKIQDIFFWKVAFRSIKIDRKRERERRIDAIEAIGFV